MRGKSLFCEFRSTSILPELKTAITLFIAHWSWNSKELSDSFNCTVIYVITYCLRHSTASPRDVPLIHLRRYSIVLKANYVSSIESIAKKNFAWSWHWLKYAINLIRIITLSMSHATLRLNQWYRRKTTYLPILSSWLE